MSISIIEEHDVCMSLWLLPKMVKNKSFLTAQMISDGSCHGGRGDTSGSTFRKVNLSFQKQPKSKSKAQTQMDKGAWWERKVCWGQLLNPWARPQSGAPFAKPRPNRSLSNHTSLACKLGLTSCKMVKQSDYIAGGTLHDLWPDLTLISSCAESLPGVTS